MAGSGKSTGALKKEAQQAGLTNLLRSLGRRDRDSNPGYSHPYAAFRVRSIRPLWHLSSSGSAALPVPCARGVVVEAVEQSLSKRKVTATFSFQQTLERKSVLWAGRFYFPGRWFVLSEQRLSVIQTGVSGFPSRVLFLFRQKSQAFRAEVCVRSDRRIVPSSHLAEVGRRSVLAGSPCPLVLPP